MPTWPLLACCLCVTVFFSSLQFELRAPDGTPVADVRECARRGGHLYLVRRGDLWVYPALAVNATTAVTVATDGEPRTYTVRALAKRPKVGGG